jgi:hypothetical protein
VTDRNAGQSVLHPTVLASIGLLVINDWWAKAHWHDAVTGKISDFAGLYFFPVLLVAAVEVLRDRYEPVAWATRRRRLAAAVMTTGVAFAVIKGLAPIQIGPRWIVRRDPTDLIALLSLGVAWLQFSRPPTRGGLRLRPTGALPRPRIGRHVP